MDLKNSEEENNILKLQISEIKSQLEKSESQSKVDKTTITLLESKVQKAESEVIEYMNENKTLLNDKIEEIKFLKSVMKNKMMKLKETKVKKASLIKI